MRFFYVFFIFLLMLAGTAYGVIYYGTHYPNPRSLTQEERAYAELIYGDSLDYDAVQVYIDSPYTTFASLTLGNSIHLKSTDLGADTASDVTRSSEGRFSLIHELGHVYQYQQSGWDYLKNSFVFQFRAYIQTGSRTNAYDWRSRVSNFDSFETWNPEEQAEALAEFSHEQDAIKAGSKTRDTSTEKLGCIIPLLTTYCSK